jgi:parvulin-like peptidyl-prolyl isomerase
LVAQLRSGADFQKAVLENSDRPNAGETKGKVDTFALPDLDDRFRNAVKNVKAGGYTDPIEIDGVGINILRVDERTAQDNDVKFDENAVRMAILSEKAPDEQKKFMSKLRSDAYIKISDEYRPVVSPILFADERTAKTSETKTKN